MAKVVKDFGSDVGGGGAEGGCEGGGRKEFGRGERGGREKEIAIR